LSVVIVQSTSLLWDGVENAGLLCDKAALLWGDVNALRKTSTRTCDGGEGCGGTEQEITELLLAPPLNATYLYTQHSTFKQKYRVTNQLLQTANSPDTPF
jgi:hypothetical protein